MKTTLFVTLCMVYLNVCDKFLDEKWHLSLLGVVVASS